MPEAKRRRELGRGERVLPGVYRLRLPLPWPGVPHCNAWALAAGDGVVLVDTGAHGPGSLAHLERALGQVNLRVDHVRLVVATHAHADHWGEAATIVERTGCELWMHPRHEHATRQAADPEAALERRLEVARQSGVPEEPLRRYAERMREQGPLIAGVVAPARDLVDGVVVDTDLGPWEVVETPGHAPSHVCLVQRQRRILLSGDHVLGRVSLYFDYGWTPDPVAEFLGALDRVDALDTRLCLPGHGRTFTDVAGHVRATRELVHERVAATEAALGDAPRTAFEVAREVYGDLFGPATAGWLLTKALCYLGHLAATGRAEREPGEDAERWRSPTL